MVIGKDFIDGRAISARLATKWLGQPVFFYPAVGSTNELLKSMASRGQPAGTLLLTDYQIQGKGRLGRRWEAPSGSSLLMSLLFRPDWPADRAIWLMMAAGVATVSAIESVCGITARLKWPNDLVIHSDGRWQKIGGLLLEGDFINGRLVSCVLGAGLNVNLETEQLPVTSFPATSLAIELGHPVSRLDLLAALLIKLEELYESADKGRSPQLSWNHMLITLGHLVAVTVAGSGETIQGLAEGTDSSGRLLVRDSSGRLNKISAGDVTLRG